MTEHSEVLNNNFSLIFYKTCLSKFDKVFLFFCKNTLAVHWLLSGSLAQWLTGSLFHWLTAYLLTGPLLLDFCISGYQDFWFCEFLESEFQFSGSPTLQSSLCFCYSAIPCCSWLCTSAFVGRSKMLFQFFSAKVITVTVDVSLGKPLTPYPIFLSLLSSNNPFALWCQFGFAG